MPRYFEKTLHDHHRRFKGERLKLLESQREKVSRWLFKKSRVDSRLESVAEALEGCRRGALCMSGACPVCGHAFQDLLSRLLRSELRGREQHVVSVTIAPISSAVPIAGLAAFDMVNHQRRFKAALRGVPGAWGLFVTDYSFNEHAAGRYEPFVLPHWHGVVVGADVAAVRGHLRTVFRPSDAVPRPVRVVSWDGDPRWLSYLFKRDFGRRIGVDGAVRFDPRSGEQRLCRATRYDRLRAAERVELALHLARFGLLDRVACIRSQLRFGPSGARIVGLG